MYCVIAALMMKFIRHSRSTTQYNTMQSNVKKQKRRKRFLKEKSELEHAYTSTKRTCDSLIKTSKNFLFNITYITLSIITSYLNVNKLNSFDILKPRLHDTTSCQTRCQTGCQTRLTTRLTNGCIVYTAGCQTGCTTRFDNRLNEQWPFSQHGCQTGCQTRWQPDWQPVVSFKRGLRIP